ncbi:plasmid replication, integration and excision activator [Nonomuraea sp. NPDC023979]|uniref:plasmid replication, integration and excision activator n=1 Tax=Nonomuraea sp. NPDC023979 TaxID=3154796 RepID=UPI003408C9A8
MSPFDNPRSWLLLALQGPIAVSQEMVFPHGCYVVGEISPVLDFEASTRERPVPARDKVTNELMWSVPVLDGDPELKASAKSVAVKVVSPVAPEIPAPPAALAGLPFVPIEFEGMTATPYVNQQGRLAWSYKATGMRAARSATLNKKGGPKDAE